MSIAEQLKNSKDDIKTLLEYAKTLRAANESTICALRGSVIFLRDDEQHKVYNRAVNETEIAFPRLKTISSAGQVSDVSKVNHTTPCGDHDNLVTGTPQAKSLNNAGGFKEMTADLSVTKEDGSRAKQKSIDHDSISDDSQPPVIHTTDDLAAVLIEHNKLKGRLLQYTTDKVSSSTIISPNIRDHNITDVSVTGLREYNNIIGFVVRVTWSNGQRFELYRKYLDFFSFQATLKGLSTCPVKNKLLTKRLFPQLPLSDHLLAVLGQLDSKKALLERLELINTFCKAVVANAVNGTGELICKTSVLIFFSVRPGDIEMKRHNSELEDSFNFLAEESEDDVDDCLGFLSSVALERETKWENVHSDLLDTPKAISRVIMIPEPSSGNTKTDLRFNQPSSAQAVITTIHSQPENNTKPSTTSFTSRSSALTHAQVVAKLSVLKTPSETDLDLAETERIRHRSKNTTSNNSQNVSLARAKAMCVRTGSTDWGVRDTRNGHT